MFGVCNRRPVPRQVAGRLASRLFFRIELTEVKERAPISSARLPGCLQPVAAIALDQPDDADRGPEILAPGESARA